MAPYLATSTGFGPLLPGIFSVARTHVREITTAGMDEPSPPGPESPLVRELQGADFLDSYTHPRYGVPQSNQRTGQSRLRVYSRVYYSNSPAPYHSLPESNELPSYLSLGTFTKSPTVLSPPRQQSSAFWLATYFALNLCLTLYNKSVLIQFPFPYTLTALHALCGSIGTVILLLMEGRQSDSWKAGTWQGVTGIPRQNSQEMLVIFLFSLLYTINIAVSNVSLKLVTIPFHQVVRASCPFFTIILSALILGKYSTRAKLVSLIPVVAGVGFATYGDYYFTAYGVFLTFLGTILAALKTVVTNLLQSSSSSSPSPSTPLHTPISPSSRHPSFIPILPKLNLTPLQLLSLLSPLACIESLFLAWLSGELGRVQSHFLLMAVTGRGTMEPVFLVFNGALAFLLNVASFSANKKVGPLGMTVAANVKQVLTILCAVTLFDLHITPMNSLGIVLTLLGGGWYAQVELQEKRARDEGVETKTGKIVLT